MSRHEEASGHGAEQEQQIAALRAALLPGVPTDLQAPPDRMERVRLRVRRTRRLRATAVALPLLALAAVLLPRPQTGADRTAVAASPGSAPTAAVSPGGSRLESLNGLRLAVPAGWRTLQVAAVGEGDAWVRYASNGPLASGSGPCGVGLDGQAVHSCLPVSLLHRSQVVVAFRVWPTRKPWADPTPFSGGLRVNGPSPVCRKLGGTESFDLDLPTAVDGSTTFLVGTACLARPSGPVRSEALTLLRTAALAARR